MAKITAGTERGRCTGPQDVKFGESANGNMQIGLLFEITAGERKGLRAPWYGSLANAQAQEITAKALMACGWDGKSWTELNGLQRNAVRLTFVEESGRVRLRYVDRDAAANFNNELSKDEAAARLSKMGLVAPRANGSPASEASDADDSWLSTPEAQHHA